MSAVGGSVETVTLDGREFPVTGDADVTRKLGGSENELSMNGNGTGRIIKTVTGWSLDGVVIETDDSRGDQEFVQDLTDRNGDFPIAITYASGITYQGSGIIVGENGASSQSASQAVSLMGPGKLTKQ